ncbi:MAG TPA: hypothetical protein VHC63_14455 [Acidimicrobiales bacterium]|nr:hypothetical protein [Acidimicrobiales bacterium]
MTPAAAQTNYPLTSSIELRDANGNLVTSTTPTCPRDGITVHSTGWLPLSSVHATFHSDPVDLGSHPVDANGNLDFTFRVPNVENGLHTLILEGVGADGQPRTVQASIVCNCNPTTTPTVAVLGQTLDATGGSSGASSATGSSTNGSVFATTGADIAGLLAIAVDLILVGVVLRLVKQHRTLFPSRR